MVQSTLTVYCNIAFDSLLLQLGMQAVNKRVSVDDDREPVGVVVVVLVRVRRVRPAARHVLVAVTRLYWLVLRSL